MFDVNATDSISKRPFMEVLPPSEKVSDTSNSTSPFSASVFSPPSDFFMPTVLSPEMINNLFEILKNPSLAASRAASMGITLPPNGFSIEAPMDFGGLITPMPSYDNDSKNSFDTQTSFGSTFGKITTNKPATDKTSTNVGRKPSNYDEIIDRVAKEEGVDPNLIRAMMKQESGGNLTAVSPKGAGGLMQLMPDTAKELGVKDRFDPEQNIRGGAKYIAQQLKRYNGDVKLALAAYNAGPGAVNQYNGIPPYKETQNYVKIVMANYTG